jgi:hypothetical protein
VENNTDQPLALKLYYNVPLMSGNSLRQGKTALEQIESDRTFWITGTI